MNDNYTKYLVKCPLYDNPVDICSALTGIASQENHDGYDDDLMMLAAEHIRVLRVALKIRSYMDYIACLNDSKKRAFFEQITDDPSILVQALELLDNFSIDTLSLLEDDHGN